MKCTLQWLPMKCCCCFFGFFWVFFFTVVANGMLLLFFLVCFFVFLQWLPMKCCCCFFLFVCLFVFLQWLPMKCCWFLLCVCVFMFFFTVAANYASVCFALADKSHIQFSLVHRKCRNMLSVSLVIKRRNKIGNVWYDIRIRAMDCLFVGWLVCFFVCLFVCLSVRLPH